jgi:predicted transcriptional regulator
MAAVASLTIELPADVAEKLGRLAEDTRRSRSVIASDALAAYVEQELRAIDGIRRGLDDVAAGRVIPHDEAMAEIDAVIEAARKRRA